MDISRLIAEKFPDKRERQTVQAILSACGHNMREDRVIALVHELARETDMPPEASVRYIGSFITNIGEPEHVAQRFMNFVEAGEPGVPDAAAPVITEPSAGEPAAPAGPSREALQAQIRQHEANMRSEPGSQGWRAYWRDGGAQEYHAALTALETAAPAPSAVSVEPAV